MGCLSDEEVVDYVEDRSPAEQAGRIATHLDGCALCRALVVSLARAGLVVTATVTHDGQAPVSEVALLEKGSTLGRYRIVDLLGAGGMGVVYSAEDTELNRRVALKLLHPDGDPTREPAALLREAQALARVSHPNVITVFEVGSFDQRVFVAMELVEGWTLREWLASAKRSWREVLAVCADAGRGVAAAHASQLVHRDLKPDNILVGDDGWVRVTDFGLALVAGRPADAAVAGTPRYMAPEQLAHGEADAASDQYSFCILMRESLAPLGAPGWVDRILTRGLSQAPQKRFESMAALLGALEQTPVRRRRAMWSVGAGCLFALTLAALALRPAPCALLAQPATALYPPERAARIRSTFEATGKPFAQVAADEVDLVVTSWLRQWSAASVEACEATYVRHAQSSELLDLRTECLRRSLDQAQALLSLLDHADARLVERASQTVHGLPELAVCDDGATLRAGPRRPTDSKVRSLLAPLEARLAQAIALQTAGKYHESLGELESLVVDARASGHLPLLAEVHYSLGDLSELSGNAEAARINLDEAIRLSEEVGDDRLKARAWVRLVFVEIKPSRAAEGQHAAKMAEATLRRIGGGGTLAAQLAAGRASIDLLEGHHDEALRHTLEAVELQEKLGPADDPRMSSVQLQLGTLDVAIGDYRGAYAAFMRACAIDQKHLGPAHPRLAACENSLAGMLCFFGQYDEALVHARRSLALRQASLGADHLLTFSSWCNVGEALRGLGKNEEALAAFDKALGARASHGEQNLVIPSAEDGMGMVLLAQGHFEKAEPHLVKSLELNQKLFGADSAEAAWQKTQLADLETRQGRAREALVLARSSVAILEPQGAAHPQLARPLLVLGQALLAAKKPELARPLLERSVAICKAAGLDPRMLQQSEQALASTAREE